MIPFPDFEPDKSRFDTTNTPVVRNVVPKPGGYGPVSSFQRSTDAQITDPVRMLASYVNDSGSVLNFAGTYDNLYKYDTGTRSWVSVAPGAVSLPAGDYWGYHRFGNLLLVTSTTSGLMYYDLNNTSGTFVSVPEAPLAKHVTSLNEYVVLGNIQNNPRRVQWSEVGDVTSWEVGENGADFQDIPDGGAVGGITFGEQLVHIIQEKAVRSMQFVGGSFTFQFTKVSDVHGIIAPASLVTARDTFFWLDKEGFNMGPQGQPIGDDRVDNWIRSYFDEGQIDQVQGEASPESNTVWWIFTKANGEKNLVGYNWKLDKWTHVEADVQFIAEAVSPGTSIDDWGTLGDPSKPFPPVDGDPMSGLDNPEIPSLDSSAYRAGLPTGAAIDKDGYFGFFSGPSMKSLIETPDIKLDEENERSFVNGYRIAIDTNNFTSAVGVCQIHGETASFLQDRRPNSEGLVTCRANGRLHRFRLETDEGATWSFVHGLFPMRQSGGSR